jgi:hypothetical protein
MVETCVLKGRNRGREGQAQPSRLFAFPGILGQNALVDFSPERRQKF